MASNRKGRSVSTEGLFFLRVALQTWLFVINIYSLSKDAVFLQHYSYFSPGTHGSFNI